jgi:hypothetical protein
MAVAEAVVVTVVTAEAATVAAAMERVAIMGLLAMAVTVMEGRGVATLIMVVWPGTEARAMRMTTTTITPMTMTPPMQPGTLPELMRMQPGMLPELPQMQPATPPELMRMPLGTLQELLA